jgi:hypothetical protein
MQLDIERCLAISELLAQPDPPEMHRRAHRRTQAGKPDRFDLVPLLSAAFVQNKLLALHERAGEKHAAVIHADAVVSARRTLPAIQAAAAQTCGRGLLLFRAKSPATPQSPGACLPAQITRHA